MCVCVFSWGGGGGGGEEPPSSGEGGGEFITINRTDDKPRSPVQCKHTTGRSHAHVKDPQCSPCQSSVDYGNTDQTE